MYPKVAKKLVWNPFPGNRHDDSMHTFPLQEGNTCKCMQIYIFFEQLSRIKQICYVIFEILWSEQPLILIGSSTGDSNETPVNYCSMARWVQHKTEPQNKASTSCPTVTCAPEMPGPDRGRWLQDVWFMLIPRLLRPGFRVMWEWRQQPAGMQLRVLAQILNLALVLVLEWIWVLVQVGVGRQNMKTDVDGRREGGGTDWPEWMMGRRGGGTIDVV